MNLMITFATKSLLQAKMRNNRVSPSATPSIALSMQRSQEASDENVQHFRIVYMGLSYTVQGKGGRRKRVILNDLNGVMFGDCVVGIMGPQGCGKSLFLKLLARRVTEGFVGKFMITAVGEDTRPLKSCFISDTDVLHESLTVRESLYFASKLQNSIKINRERGDAEVSAASSADLPNDWSARRLTESSIDYHDTMSDLVMKEFHLDDFAEVTVKNLPLLQRRCLAIGQELVSKPNILFLDEPFANLDPAAAFFLLDVLNNWITSRFRMVIVCCVTNPPGKVFASFGKIICLSCAGTVVYDGFPDNSIPFLASFGLVCPSSCNPADFLLEVAAGEHGYDVIERMTQRIKEITSNNITFAVAKPGSEHPNFNLYEESSNDTSKQLIKTVTGSSRKNGSSLKKKFSKTSSSVDSEVDNQLQLNVPVEYPAVTHFTCLLYRSLLMMIRNPGGLLMRIFNYLQVSLLIGGLYNRKIGKEDGCSPLYLSSYQPTTLRSNSTDNMQSIMDNTGYLFVSVAIVFFASVLLTILIFSPEMPLLRKEVHNRWHGVGSYLLARSLVELPLQILLPAAYWLITYSMNGQPHDPVRVTLSLVIILLIAMTGQTFGLIFTSIFIDNTLAAIIVGPLNLLPMFIFANFFAKVDHSNLFFKILSNVSPARDAFEGILVAIYGLRRCSHEHGLSIIGHILPGWLVSFLKSHNSSALTSILPNTSLSLARTIIETNRKPDVIGRTMSHSSVSNGTMVAKKVPSLVNSTKLIHESGASATSYVLDLFNLTDERIVSSIVGLTVNMMILRIVSWLILRWRVRANPK